MSIFGFLIVCSSVDTVNKNPSKTLNIIKADSDTDDRLILLIYTGLITQSEQTIIKTKSGPLFSKNSIISSSVLIRKVENMLSKDEGKLWSVNEMERTGGEPDVVKLKSTDEIAFIDCSIETPSGRRNVCYDREALDSRKTAKPENTAVDLANEMGIEILDEEQYRQLQEVGEFDLKTSTWILTPSEIRKLDGALFCDRRYNHVFTYHNGASSYYSSRGFRGILKLS